MTPWSQESLFGQGRGNSTFFIDIIAGVQAEVRKM
jgi:hypothetical protein